MAQRFALLALDWLDAKVTLTPMAGFGRLAADFEADVVQACTITLEPVPSRLVESFTLTYGPAEDEGEIVLDGDSETVEPLDDGVIDIGEAVAQQLSLALDPFPRAPGVSIDSLPHESGDEATPGEAAGMPQRPNRRSQPRPTAPAGEFCQKN